MASKLPYVARPSTMVNILAKVKEARVPPRFTQDFLETKLGFKGGNARQFIPLAKKLGLVNSDGTPSDRYKRFRNPTHSKAAMAAALKEGYAEVFERNEYAGALSKEKLKGLVVEITGRASGDEVVRRTCTTFLALKELADFEAKLDEGTDTVTETSPIDDTDDSPPLQPPPLSSELNLGLSYTINLVLPKTDDPAVFNAIFRSLRDNLLNR